MRFVIPVLVGAAIGYTTNWIAIKMLFRPYYEKYFLGIHIPFTPGLIPKERGRIARSVGDTVGSYLLTPEIVMKSLSNGNSDDYIKIWVESNVDRLKEEDSSIRELIVDSHRDRYGKFFDMVKDVISKFICRTLNKKEFKEELMTWIEEYIVYNPNDRLFKSINQGIESSLYGFLQWDGAKFELEKLLENWIQNSKEEDRNIGEILPPKLIPIIGGYIEEQSENILDLLKKMLDDPYMDQRIKDIISRLVSQNMNRAIAMFLSPEIVADKVLDIIKRNMDKPEIHETITLILTTITDKALKYRAGDLVSDISSRFPEGEIARILDNLWEGISKEENMKKVLHIVGKGMESNRLVIEKNTLEFISIEVENALNHEDMDSIIYNMVDTIVESIMNRPISSIFTNIDEFAIENMVEFCRLLFDDFIQNRLPPMVELFNISKVVEEQINSFSVEFAEEVILEIAHKELKAITWLGALLGGIMGILSPLLQRI